MTKRLRVGRISIAALVVLLAVVAGCSSGSGSDTTGDTTSAPTTTTVLSTPVAVGQITETFTDTDRPTHAWGSNPEKPSRELPTTILYPAKGSPQPGKATPDAPPDPQAEPYPVILFSHGFSANPQVYMPLLTHWAAAGFVVAAPTFPLTSSKTPGGADAGDVVNQPGDISYVLDQVLKMSKAKTGTLAGMVDADEVGAAGHSNGAITTLGLIGNTCCQDKRIKAAEILSGTMTAYPGGTYELDKAPPLLVVHGTGDKLVPYEGGVEAFNAAKGPKGLLTIEDGSHMSAAALEEKSADAVLQPTTDFFNAYLRDDKAALERLPNDEVDGVTKMKFVAEKGSDATVPTTPAAKVDLQASASPTKDLTNGQTVTVSWTGFTPGKVINVLQCSADNESLTNQSGCDFKHAKLLHPDPTGDGSLTMQVITGKVGTGTCDAAHGGCFLVANNASSPDPKSMVKIPISFAE